MAEPLLLNRWYQLLDLTTAHPIPSRVRSPCAEGWAAAVLSTFAQAAASRSRTTPMQTSYSRSAWRSIVCPRRPRGHRHRRRPDDPPGQRC